MLRSKSPSLRSVAAERTGDPIHFQPASTNVARKHDMSQPDIFPPVLEHCYASLGNHTAPAGVDRMMVANDFIDASCIGASP